MSDSKFAENGSGLFVPSGTAPQQPTANHEGLGALLKIQKLKRRTTNAKNSMGNFQSILFWVNGVTTGLYAVIISYRWYAGRFGPPDSFNQWALAGLVMALSAGFLLSVLDLARYFWAEGAIASHSTNGQRGLARLMALLNFLGSLIASTVATRFLISMMGAATLTGVEQSIGTFTTLLTVSLIINLVAGYIYSEMSPEKQMLGKVSQKSSDHEEAILDAFETALAGSELDVSAKFLEHSDRLRAALVSEDAGANMAALPAPQPEGPPADDKPVNEFVIFKNEPVLHGLNGNGSNGTGGNGNG